MRRVSRRWYLLGLIPFVICSIISGFLVNTMISDVEAMQRVVVPGEGTVQLTGGDWTAFGETTSKVNGIVYDGSSFRVTCTLLGASGASLHLETPTGKTRYSFGDYKGSAVYHFTVAEPGVHRLSCTDAGSGKRAVIAFGQGFAAGLVKALVMFFAGLIASVLGIVMLVRRRRQWLAAQARG